MSTTTLPTRRTLARSIIGSPRCAWKGYREADGDMGMTYDDDPDSRRSRAYDAGREIGARRIGRV